MAKHSHPMESTDPYRLLADADAAFAAGDHYLGSALLWESTECALVNLAKRYGHPHDTDGDDLLFFSEWLDNQTGTRYYTGGHTTASLFGNNAKYRFIEPEEMEISIPRVHDFISALTSYPVPPKTS